MASALAEKRKSLVDLRTCTNATTKTTLVAHKEVIFNVYSLHWSEPCISLPASPMF